MISLATGQSLAARIAEIADRQRIEQTYAQGATQIYGLALQANCSREQAATLNFFIPEEMRIVNKVLAKIRLGPFRAYSKTTDTVALRAYTSYTESVQRDTASAGAAKLTGTSAGGVDGAKMAGIAYQGNTGDAYTYIRLQGGGNNGYVTGKTDSVDGSKGAHTHSLQMDPHWHSYYSTEHRHSVLGRHSHTVTIPSHAHQITVKAHGHSFAVPAHNHGVEIPAHRHTITPGIYKFGRAGSFSVAVNGTRKTTVSGQTAELDLTTLLLSDGDKIERGKWFTLGILPDDLAYVSIVLMVQGFIQSRGTYNA